MLEVLVESVEVRVPLKLWPCANMGLLAMRRVVCMRSCGWRDDNPWANLSEDVDNCEVFSTKWVGNVTFGGDLVQDQVHLLPVVPSSSCGD